MKKLISILVTAALAVTSVFALAGCNSAEGEESIPKTKVIVL